MSMLNFKDVRSLAAQFALELSGPAPLRVQSRCNSLHRSQNSPDDNCEQNAGARGAGISGVWRHGDWRRAESAREAAAAIDRAMPVLTDDPTVLTGCDGVDAVVEATGTIEPAAALMLDAIEHGKHVVMVNAELDFVLGPILNAKAIRSGVVMTHTDGEEPGVAMTLLRYLKSVGSASGRGR